MASGAEPMSSNATPSHSTRTHSSYLRSSAKALSALLEKVGFDRAVERGGVKRALVVEHPHFGVECGWGAFARIVLDEMGSDRRSPPIGLIEDAVELQLQQELLARDAWIPRKGISQGGLVKYVHGKEYHAYNPDVVKTLQEAEYGIIIL